MIIELTKENLQKCGFDTENIKWLTEIDNYVVYAITSYNCFFATNIEKKIYTEIDGYRKFYFEKDGIQLPFACPDLIPDYFDLALRNYLDEKKALLKTMFVEADQCKKFILNEIENKKNSIEVNKHDLKKNYNLNELTIKKIDILDSYISFLEKKLNEQPQQDKNNKSDAVEKILFDFIINVDKKNDFLFDLKNVFSTDKGKTIKAMINILIENKMLLIPDRQFATFYKLFEANFNRNIGSYTSINDAEKSIPFDSKFLEPIKTKIIPLIIKYKSME